MTATLVWMDLEMTGIDSERDSITEIATIVTDDQLNVVEEGPVFAVSQPEEVLAGMDDWNQKTHGESGLIRRIREEGVAMADAEAETLAFISRHVEEGQAPLCGNTIWQDRRFLVRYMPKLEDYLHYRLIDVSTVKELARRWVPAIAAGHTKKGAHTALSDIRESIDELKYYRSTFFRES